MRCLRFLKRKVILSLPALLALTLLSMGVAQPGWAALETVKAFGLVESGTLTEATIFNDGSVVYVRVNVGVQAGGLYANVIITENNGGGNSITITVYDNGYLPDNDNIDTYYWGKFTLRQGDGTGTSDADDILELSDTETAKIEANLDNEAPTGELTITAGYSTFTDHANPLLTLWVSPDPFSPDGDGINDTTTISIIVDDASTPIYGRVEIRDSSDVMVRNLYTPADGTLSTGDYIWDGKYDTALGGGIVPNDTYNVYVIVLDSAQNSSQQTTTVDVETIYPEISEVTVSPDTISPQNGDGVKDLSTITFKAVRTGGGLTFEIKDEAILIRDLTSSITVVGDHYSVTWNGKKDDGSRAADKTYTCRIWAKNLSGNETTNTDATVTVDNTAPSAVTNLSASAVAGGDIKLSWTASSSPDADQYNIYQATSSGGQSYTTPYDSVSFGTDTYTDTSTTDGTTYYYVVRTQDTVANIETNTTEVSAKASATGPSFSNITADSSGYKDGDTIELTVTLANHNTGCTLTADFSNIDSQYVTGGEAVVNWGTDGKDNDGDGHIDNPDEQGIYVITYLISTANGQSDTSYSVSVTATDAASNSASSSISLDLDNTAPSAPTNLSATALSAGGIELSWAASSSGDLAQYKIYQATSSGGQNYSSYTYQVSSGTTTYTDTATTDGTTYYYVVRAQDAVGNIETNTNEASATAGVTEAPSFSSITSDESTYKDGDTIELTVTLANHNTGCTLTADFSNIDSQYVTGGEAVVNWGTDGKDNDGDGHIDNPDEQGVYVISYLISLVNAKADGSYSVSVTATDAATNSASSSISLALDNTAPPAPTGLTASAIVGGSIQLTWTRSSPETDVSQYNIYRASSSGGENYSSPTYTVSAGTSSYTDTATSDGQIYYYVVRAQDAAGNIETNTNEVSATASGSGPPAPTGLTATAIAGGSIQLDWTLSSPETDVAQYNIYRAINSGEQNYASPLTNVSAGTSTHTDTTTTDGVTYYYVVRAQDALGNSESNTNEASATADATAPPAPTNFVASTIVGSGIQLNWTPSSPETDVSQYNIYRASSSGDQNYSSPTYSVSAGNIGYTDTSVSDGATYYYVVRAQDVAGNIETNTNEVWATVSLAGPSANVSDIYLKYEEETLYDLASSTDPGAPVVFARAKIDEVYLRLNLVGGFVLNESSCSIILFKGIDEDAEEVSGSQNINQGAGWAEFIFHIDPPFDPDVDEHSRDALYWVDVCVVSTTDSVNDFDFYFLYDTTSPAVPDFGITSFDASSGTISVSGKTWPDSSDPQQVEIFLNGASQGVVTADGAGNFSIDNLVLASGDNYITVQSTDKADNKSELSAFLRQRYNSENLLSIVIRSSHVVKSGSATIPVEIIYAVTEPAQVTIHIHNLLGKTVKEWSQWVNPGEEPEWSWLGENMYGETVNNGVYILKVIADNGSGRRENVTKLLGVLR